MFCRFCGTEINNQSKFCSSCGKPQNSVKKSTTNIWPTVLQYIIGAFFILGGVLPYLLQGDLADYNAYILSLLHPKYSSPTAFSAILCFSKFASFLSPLFYFSSSVLAIYIGLLLLKKESKLTVPVITCAIVHIVSIIYSVVVNLLIYTTPKFVLSLYTNEASVITAGEDIIRSEPEMLYYYQDNAICRLIISVIIITLVIIFLFFKRRYMNNATNDNINTSSIGGVIMILSISALSVVSSVLSTSLGGYYYWIYSVEANSVVKPSFELNISFTVILMFIIIISIAVLFTRIKRWILAIPTISVIVVLGFIGILLHMVLGFVGLLSSLVLDHFSNMLIPDMEIYAMTLINFRGLIISSAVILIAMFYWFSSVSRNKIPTWLQIALPLSLPLIYTGIEIITGTVLHLNPVISYGLIGVALITVMASLLVRSNKQQVL